jgi:prepilin-type N-terminal cleavage/methylation domain-containing protein
MKSRSDLGQKGFTLIEILVSLIVFGLLTSSVFYFLNQQNSQSMRATDSQKSLSLAKLALDSLKVAPYDSLRAGLDTLDGRYIRSWHISVLNDDLGQDKGSRQIDLSVYWPLSAANKISLATLVSDERFKEEANP